MMTQNIYIDVYFGFNFLMDFLVILILEIIVKSKKAVVRGIISSIVGALYAVILLVFNMKGGMIYFLTYIVISEIMLWISLGKQTIKDNIKNIVILYGITFFMNGIINLLYYGFDSSHNIVRRANSTYYGRINIFIVLIIGVTLCIVIKKYSDSITKYIKNLGNIYKVSVVLGSKEIELKALRDTGNSLVEPMTGKPVSIVEKNAVNQFKNETIKYLLVPYNSVGKKHGLLEAFIADKISVNGIEIEKAIIGIYNGKLSQNNKYEMILNPNLFEKEK